MPEEKTESETGAELTPMPGPWTVEQCDANARLIAAAGTAASEAAEMGYDPVAAVEALPELVTALENYYHAETQGAKDDALDKLMHLYERM